jgi:hypothetical protein
MLTIRKEQMEAFREARFERLVERVAKHLRDTLPDAYTFFGKETVRSSAKKAVSRCRRYSVNVEYDVFRYFNLMFVLGFDFDTDSGCPWAASILNDPMLTGTVKMDLLNSEARAFLDRR